MRESVIEKYLVDRVKALGGEVRKVVWQGRRGAPDRLVMLPNRWAWKRAGFSQCTMPPATFWVELKATGVKPEAYQLREHDRMCKMGQHVVVVDSIEGVDGLLGEP